MILVIFTRLMSLGHHGRWPKKQQALKSMDRPSLECNHFLSFYIWVLFFFHILLSWWNFPIALTSMFETHPPWRNLWQHMGSRLPIEDQMVLPRWLHNVHWSLHFIIFLVSLFPGLFGTQWPTWPTWTRWLGRQTIRRRWLHAFSGLPSRKFHSLTKYENT